IISNVNPAYDYYENQEFVNALAKVPVKISLNRTLDETSKLVDYVCPQHHFLEAWDDAQPKSGVFSLTQPAIAPLFETRAYQESLVRWTGDSRSFYDVLRQSWKEKLFPRQRGITTFDDFWDHSLQDGFAAIEGEPAKQASFVTDGIVESVERLSKR